MNGGSNISTVETEKRRDYLVGVASFSILLLSILIAWVLALLFCSYVGKNRVGWLAGLDDADEKLLTQTDTEDDDDDSLEFEEAWECQDSIQCTDENISPSRNTFRYFRFVFLICGVAFVASAFVFANIGVANLQLTVNSVHETSSQINELAHQVRFILSAEIPVLSPLSTYVASRINEELAVEQFCPGNPTLDNSDLAWQVKQNAASVRDQMSDIPHLTSSFDTGAIQKILDSLIMGAERVQSATAKIRLTSWCLLLFLFLYTTIPTLLMASAVMALLEVSFRFQVKLIKFVLLPLFGLLVAMAWLGAAGFAAASAVNFDICMPERATMTTIPYKLDGPDVTILEVIEQVGFGPDTVEYWTTLYYVSFCSIGIDPLHYFVKYQPSLVS